MRVKYFPFYASLYEGVKDLEPDEFKRALMPLLEYAFTDQEHEKDPDRFFELFFTTNKPFIEKLVENTENGKKGGAPSGNQNAKGHGAPKGNSNAKGHGRPKKNKQPDIDIDIDNETENDIRYIDIEIEKEKEIEIDKDTHSATASDTLDAVRSEPQKEPEPEFLPIDEIIKREGW